MKPGIVQQDVDVGMALDDPASEFGHRSQVGEIAKDDINLGVRRGGLDQGQSVLRAPPVAGGQHQAGAATRQLDGGALAKAARGARDDDCRTVRHRRASPYD
jgi:hypothetical protein